MKNFTLILLFHALLLCSAQAQNIAADTDHIPGEMIVQLKPGNRPEDFIAKLNRQTGGASGLFLKKTMVDEWRIYLIGYNPAYTQQALLLDKSFQLPEVEFAQWNHYAEERSLTPNDPDWFQQADMSLINAPEAWETSTGGLTANGDTIVVAVMEQGALLTHPDLAPNRWWNWDEIPNDGIDNDGNGYVDDFGGWNLETEQDDLGNKGVHGTAIYGIIGAAGNNNLGVTGVNWNVKMMNLSGVHTDVSIIEACYYVFKMRRMYNQSNGAKGAFVVATNASFGFANRFPCETQNLCTWCSLFDSLGTVGVLNMGATVNAKVDVDVEGDMPTTCASEYLIAVTNVTTLGSKFDLAGYGKVSIDLGAPGGFGTYTTTTTGNDLPTFGSQIGGTSAATPHVTGTVALLYSLGCEGFTADALSNPGACARRVRDAILENTHPEPSLDSITVTGGYLDIKKAVDGVTELCKGSVGPLKILQVRTLVDGDEVRLFYQTPIFQPYRFRIFNILGQIIHDEELNPSQFSENSVRFNFANQPRGVYVLSISRGNAIISVKFPKI